MGTSSGVCAPVAAGKPDSVAAGSSDTRTSQRVVKLCVKGLADKLDQLQNTRKVKLNKASALRKSIQESMQGIKVSVVKQSLHGFIELCD